MRTAGSAMRTPAARSDVNVAMPQRRGTAEETKATRIGHTISRERLVAEEVEEGVAVSPEPRTHTTLPLDKREERATLPTERSRRSDLPRFPSGVPPQEFLPF